MIIKIFIVSFLSFFYFLSKAQPLSASVIGSSGNISNLPTGSLEWTLGEIMTETYQSGSSFLTQGFHQTVSFSTDQFHSIIGFSGGSSMLTNGSIEWTMGEIMVETYQKSNAFLTQGFHQPMSGSNLKNSNLARARDFLDVDSIDVKANENYFLCYPNPVWDFLNLSASEEGEYLFELFNLQGQKLASQKASMFASSVYQIDVQGLSVAVYLLSISNTATGKRTYYKIQKL